jgi:hypothetical protein
MSNTHKKTLLFDIPVENDPEYRIGMPNFTYLEIDSSIEDMLEKGKNMVMGSVFHTVHQQNCHLPYFVFNRDSVGQDSVEKSTPSACDLVISEKAFWLEVKLGSNSSVIKLRPTSFQCLQDLLCDHEVEKIQAELYTDWSADNAVGNTCQTPALINLRSGEIEINGPVASSEECLKNQYIVTSEGDQYQAFRVDANGPFFVAPIDLERLWENQQSVSPQL